MDEQREKIKYYFEKYCNTLQKYSCHYITEAMNERIHFDTAKTSINKKIFYDEFKSCTYIKIK